MRNFLSWDGPQLSFNKSSNFSIFTWSNPWNVEMTWEGLDEEMIKYLLLFNDVDRAHFFFQGLITCLWPPVLPSALLAVADSQTAQDTSIWLFQGWFSKSVAVATVAYQYIYIYTYTIYVSKQPGKMKKKNRNSVDLHPKPLVMTSLQDCGECAEFRLDFALVALPAFWI